MQIKSINSVTTPMEPYLAYLWDTQATTRKRVIWREVITWAQLTLEDASFTEDSARLPKQEVFTGVIQSPENRAILAPCDPHYTDDEDDPRYVLLGYGRAEDYEDDLSAYERYIKNLAGGKS